MPDTTTNWDERSKTFLSSLLGLPLEELKEATGKRMFSRSVPGSPRRKAIVSGIVDNPVKNLINLHGLDTISEYRLW